MNPANPIAKIRALVVDDEPVARERIAAHAPELVACRLPLPGDLFEVETSPGLCKAA